MTEESFIKDKQTEEALCRMCVLSLPSSVIGAFVVNGEVHVSRGLGIVGPLKDEERDRIEQLEEQKGLLVYHAIYSIQNGYRMLTLFFVSKYMDEWGKDRENLPQGKQNCYVFNLDDSRFSEFGYVGFQRGLSGLVRTW